MEKKRWAAAALAAALLFTGTSCQKAQSTGQTLQTTGIKAASAVSGTSSGASSSAAKSTSSAVSSAAGSGQTAGTTSSASSETKASSASSQDSSGTASEETEQAAQPALSLSCKSAVLAEQSTGRVLYSLNPHEKMHPASIAKVMTELLVLEAIESGRFKMTDTIQISAHASSMGGSDIWLEPGETMSVNDLFKAMVVNSANDAAVALAEKVSGSEQGFVKLMNQKAKTLGMNDTHFTNATGLDADDNLTSAYDVMLMSKALLDHKTIFNYTTIWMDSVRDGKTALYNTNKLIRFYQGANGLKTGSTSQAGFSLSGTALRDNMQLIAVVMNCPVLKDRFTSAEALLDYGFANWSRVTPKKLSQTPSVNVLHGAAGSVQAVPDQNPSLVVEKGKESGIQQKVTMAQNVEAPVEKGQVLGQITFWIDGKQSGSIPLRAKNSVGRLTFGGAFGRIFSFIVGRG